MEEMQKQAKSEWDTAWAEAKAADDMDERRRGIQPARDYTDAYIRSGVHEDTLRASYIKHQRIMKAAEIIHNETIQENMRILRKKAKDEEEALFAAGKQRMREEAERVQANWENEQTRLREEARILAEPNPEKAAATAKVAKDPIAAKAAYAALDALVARSKNAQGNTPLIQAVKNNNLSEVNEVLNNGDDPLFHALDGNNKTAFSYAKDDIRKAILDAFYQKIAYKNTLELPTIFCDEALPARYGDAQRWEMPLPIASHPNPYLIEIYSDRLERKANKDNEERLAEFHRKQEERVKQIAEWEAAEPARIAAMVEEERRGADLTARFQNAVAKGELQRVKDMISVPPNGPERINYDAKNADGLTVIQVAMKDGNQDIVNAILDSGELTNHTDFSSLLKMAVEKDMDKVVDNLFVHDSSLNVSMQDDDGNTLLHIAAMKGNRAIAEILVNKGANVLTKNKDGKWPVELASSDFTDLLGDPKDYPKDPPKKNGNINGNINGNMQWNVHENIQEEGHENTFEGGNRRRNRSRRGRNRTRKGKKARKTVRKLRKSRI